MIKKKDLDQDNTKAWEEYIKNPSDIYDKDKNFSKEKDIQLKKLQQVLLMFQNQEQLEL